MLAQRQELAENLQLLGFQDGRMSIVQRNAAGENGVNASLGKDVGATKQHESGRQRGLVGEEEGETRKEEDGQDSRVKKRRGRPILTVDFEGLMRKIGWPNVCISQVSHDACNWVGEECGWVKNEGDMQSGW